MIVYAGGTFDVPHAGHVNFLRQCKELFPNSYLTVALNTDEFIERYKGKAPLFSYNERESLLMKTGYVNKIVENTGGEDSKPSIIASRCKVVIIGNDWLEKDYCRQMGFNARWLRDKGITLCYLPYTDEISTTIIKERMKNA